MGEEGAGDEEEEEEDKLFCPGQCIRIARTGPLYIWSEER